MEVLEWIVGNGAKLIELWVLLIGIASIIVKMTPTVKDDNILKGVLRFTGKFIALNRK